MTDLHCSTLRERVVEAAIRVAPELFAAEPPTGRIADAYVEGDAFVVEMEFDLSVGPEFVRVPHLVADEVAATIALPSLAVWCRVRMPVGTDS